MAPTTQNMEPKCDDKLPYNLNGESVVISGISGLYPQTHHVKELDEILYNKVNPVTQSKSRWNYSHPEVPPYTGTIPNLEYFDAQFFKIHYRQAVTMDPMSRKILEQSYQAILDAGLSAEALSGKKLGVYIGACFSEAEKTSFYDKRSRTGFGITGCSKTMFANRISYWLNAKGPSMTVDEACCSSMSALELAVEDIRLGECEAAIVGGTSICLHPQFAIHYERLITLCKDGKTKSFDKNCDGCARSEGINVLFLQRAKDAKRIYAHVLHVKNEFIGHVQGEKGPEFGFDRNPKDMAKFIETFYDEARVPPEAVEYVEAFGSATSNADKHELEAIDKVFCKNRREPLFVGTVVSNIGYCEAASGIASITKVLLAYRRGEIAGNLNCNQPRDDVAGLRENRMRILTDHQPFRRTYVGVNNLSVTGVNAHVLLHGYYKPKDLNRYKSYIPRLVTISGRQESSVKKVIEDLKSRPIDAEEIGLLHNIYETSQPGFMSRGYVVLDTNEKNETVCLAEHFDYFDNEKRPLWFVYSGMGSQWTSMGTQLMRIPIFAAAIARCDKVLAPKGVDIVKIITDKDKTMFDNILHSFVGIAAIQIGLTDILTAMGIVPDKIIGHSVGELGCGYADGCFTAEEMILSAYSRGLVSVQTPFIRGSMAAVGIGYQQIVKLCPPEIEVACHNGPESSTISGPADVMKEFVGQLTAQGIFAKEVPCSNIAYHSRYIAEAGPKLLEYLSAVIKSPKRRSDRWVSTSVPQERWGETEAQYCSAWYHTNNLLSSVLFEETSRLVPSNAILIEVAPHGLLQAILKRSLSPDCRHIPLTKRGHSDNTLYLLEAMGKLYMEGYNPKLQVLYPKIEFPVSTATPMLSHLVEWNHSEKWVLPLFVSAERKTAAVCNFLISTHDDEHAYLKGNVVRGTTQYPFAAALVAVWDTLAMARGIKKQSTSVEFHDVHLFAQPPLHEFKQLQFTITFHWGTGEFEVMSGLSKVATGFITLDKVAEKAIKNEENSNENLNLDSKVIYGLLKERNYSYADEFCSIHRANSSFTKAQIVWNGSWVTFIDGILQMNVLRHNHNNVSQPSHINKLVIDLQAHSSIEPETSCEKPVLMANLSPLHRYTRCGGVYLSKVEFYDLPPLNSSTVKLQSSKFIPYFQTNVPDLEEMYSVYQQMIFESINKKTIKIVEISNEDGEIKDKISNNIQGYNIAYEKLSKASLEKQETLDADIVLGSNLLADRKKSELLQRAICSGTWIINERKTEFKNYNVSSELFKIVSSSVSGELTLELLRWKPAKKQPFTSSFIVRNEADVSKLIATRYSMPENSKLLVISSYPPEESLKTLIKTWRSESIRNQIYLVAIMNDKLDLSWESLDLDLPFNVLKDGTWGGEYYVPWQENIAYVRGMTLHSETPCDLNSLKWVEVPEPPKSGITVTVRYAGINDFDVKTALGVIPPKKDNSYGMDFSGTTDSGERVMGLVPGGAVSGRVVAVPDLLWPVPENWTLEDAATVPLAYAQAFYCLGIKTQLHPGMKILVHGGAGALGQAVISIALANQCEVFTTVSSVEKKTFLRKLFPQLKGDHIGNSRNESFGDMVLQLTKGYGCDIIISCVKKSLKNTTLRCGAYCGITFDLVEAHSEDSFVYGMNYMTKQRSYALVDIATIFDYTEDKKALQEMISEGIARGYVRPLSRVTYAAKDATRAFRFLAASHHRGRVLLRLRDAIISAQPIITCSENLSHLILCTKEGLGLQLAERLVSRGARKLYLLCPTSLPDHLLYKIKLWQENGVNVEISTEKLTSATVSNLLKKCSAPIEGVYVVISSTSDRKMDTVISDLDLATRKNGSSLKYFAILNAKDSTGEYVCIKRAQDKLPAVMLRLSPWNQGSLPWRNALDTIEQTLLSTQTILRMQVQPKHKTSLLQQISSILDIRISESVDENTELIRLGLDSSKAQSVYAFLRNSHNMCLDEEKIPYLTIKQVNELEDALTEPEIKDVSGFKTFFNYVDNDELLASINMVFLPTLVKKSKMRDEEIDYNQTYLVVVPGLEGHHERFRTLCSRLKIPALVLQPGSDNIKETLQDTAKRYTQVLKKKIQIKDNFYILGYESGVKIALELASNLENEGMTGTVFCLGGTPEELDDAVEEKLREFESEEHLQKALICHMSELMASGSSQEVTEALKDAYTWDEKLDASVNNLLGHVSHSKQYIRLMIDAVYMRIQKMRYNRLRPRQLRSRIIVLRALLKNFNSQSDDSQNLSQQPVLTYNLNTPLAHVAKDPQCPAIINRHLDEEILKTFYSRSLCDNYVLNAGTLISKANAD